MLRTMNIDRLSTGKISMVMLVVTILMMNPTSRATSEGIDRSRRPTDVSLSLHLLISWLSSLIPRGKLEAPIGEKAPTRLQCSPVYLNWQSQSSAPGALPSLPSRNRRIYCRAAVSSQREHPNGRSRQTEAGQVSGREVFLVLEPATVSANGTLCNRQVVEHFSVSIFAAQRQSLAGRHSSLRCCVTAQPS